MPNDCRHALSDAIENCYCVFSKYDAPLKWHASPERKPEELLATLTKVPLRELTNDPLANYAFWAITTVGDPEHYKHFLPRILELAIGDGRMQPGMEPWLIAGKLEMAHWRQWTSDEIDAVERCYRATLAAFLNDPDLAHDADDWLESMEKLAIEPSAT